MTANSWIQFVFICVLLLARPLGWYMARVYEGKPCGLDRALGWLERGIYRLAGVDPAEEMGWRQYTVRCCCSTPSDCSRLSAAAMQGVLPLNPQGFPANAPDLAFDTAASFATNTNWQSYGGETTMSYLSQMLGLDGAELRLGRVRHGGAGGADPRPRAPLRQRRSATSGSTWCGRRSTSCCRCRSCWPLVLVSQGVIQNFKPYETVERAAADDGRRRHER